MVFSPIASPLNAKGTCHSGGAFLPKEAEDEANHGYMGSAGMPEVPNIGTRPPLPCGVRLARRLLQLMT